MAEVENIQEESVEPTPNPYNLKKDWHTDDVMPKHGETAEGLFFEKPQAKSEPEPVQADTVEEDKAYSQPNYKKRYDDLKKHYDSRLSEFKQREQELIAEATANRPEYQAPKTAEELEQFKAEYPDNASLASKATDLFKLENGLAPVKPSQNKSVRSSAADMVSTKTTTVDEKQPKIWTQQEIAALPMAEYDRLEKEIDKAVEEGRVI